MTLKEARKAMKAGALLRRKDWGHAGYMFWREGCVRDDEGFYWNKSQFAEYFGDGEGWVVVSMADIEALIKARGDKLIQAMKDGKRIGTIHDEGRVYFCMVEGKVLDQNKVVWSDARIMETLHTEFKHGGWIIL